MIKEMKEKHKRILPPPSARRDSVYDEMSRKQESIHHVRQAGSGGDPSFISGGAARPAVPNGKKLYPADAGNFSPLCIKVFHTTVSTHVEWISSHLAEIFRLRCGARCSVTLQISICLRPRPEPSEQDATDVLPSAVSRPARREKSLVRGTRLVLLSGCISSVLQSASRAATWRSERKTRGEEGTRSQPRSSRDSLQMYL